MNEEKNIDRLFQEKFKDFEMAPSDAVWDRISESLPKKKKKRRVITLWWQIGGVAAVIALLLTLGLSILNSSDENTPTIVDTEKTNSNSEKNSELNGTNHETPSSINTDLNIADSNETEESNSKDDTNLDQVEKGKETLTSTDSKKSNAIVNTNSKEDQGTQNSNKSLTEIKDDYNNSTTASNTNTSESEFEQNPMNDSQIKSVIKNTVKNKNTAVTANTSVNDINEAPNYNNSNINTENNTELDKDTSLLTEDKEKKSILDAIADNGNTEDIDEKEKEDEQNRWSIAPNVAPVYYSSLGQGSSIDQQFNNNSKSGNINMSYGISGSYAITSKFKVRAGINRVNLNQTTSDVYAFSGSEFAARNAEVSMGNISVRDGFQNVTLMSSGMFDSNSAPEIFNSKLTGSIDQRFGFIEIPLELEYKILDRKFGLNVIGGFSTFFLNQNEVYADIEGASTLIGESNNINDTSFSANFGLGLDYNLSTHWNLNLEPQFKYQINTFNNTSGNYRPFFIGLYTGLSYKF